MYLSDDQREKAGEISLALSFGYAELAEAVLWADSIIESTDEISDTIISISLAKDVPSAMEYLNKLSVEKNEWNILKLFFARFKSIKILPHAQASKLAEHLYKKCNYEDAPHQFSCLSNHWDVIDLAITGMTKDDPDVKVEEFLDDIRKCAD